MSASAQSSWASKAEAVKHEGSLGEKAGLHRQRTRAGFICSIFGKDSLESRDGITTPDPRLPGKGPI